MHDYRTLSFSLKAHPVSFLRQQLDRRGIVRCADLGNHRNGAADRGGGAGAGAAAAGHGERRGLRHARGRDRHRQHHHLVEGVRDAPAHDPRLAHAGGARQAADRGAGHPCRRRELHRHDADLVALANGQSIGDAVLARATRARLDAAPFYELPRAASRRKRRARQARAAMPQGRNFK